MRYLSNKILVRIILIIFLALFAACDSDQKMKNSNDTSVHFSDIDKCVFAFNPYGGVKYSVTINDLPYLYKKKTTTVNGVPFRWFKEGRNKIDVVVEKGKGIESLRKPALNVNVGRIVNRQSSRELFDKNIMLNEQETKRFEFKIYIDNAPSHVWKEASRIRNLSEKDREEIKQLFKKYCNYIKRGNMEKFRRMMKLPIQQIKNIAQFSTRFPEEEFINKRMQGLKEVMSIQNNSKIQCLDTDQIRIHKRSRGVMVVRKESDSDRWIVKVKIENGNWTTGNLTCVKINGSWQILYAGS